MLDVQVIDDPAAAVVALGPIRARILAELTAPASAKTLADTLGLTRQKVNYHLRALEDRGLVTLAEERKWGGLTERLMVATASSYLVSPAALDRTQHQPLTEDRLSARYLVAIGARVVREVSELARRAGERHQRLATLAIDTEIRFRSAADRAAFADELSSTIADLVSKYHYADAPSGRPHRLIVGAHPIPTDVAEES